jgi:hypothetical protein
MRKVAVVLIGVLALAGCGTKSASKSTVSASSSPQATYCHAVQKWENDLYNAIRHPSSVTKSMLTRDISTIGKDAVAGDAVAATDQAFTDALSETPTSNEKGLGLLDSTCQKDGYSLKDQYLTSLESADSPTTSVGESPQKGYCVALQQFENDLYNSFLNGSVNGSAIERDGLSLETEAAAANATSIDQQAFADLLSGNDSQAEKGLTLLDSTCQKFGYPLNDQLLPLTQSGL